LTEILSSLRWKENMTKEVPMKGKRPDYIVNTVTELEGSPARWREIDVAFKNDDKDTMTILLDAVPLSGRLVLTRPKEKERQGPEPRRE